MTVLPMIAALLSGALSLLNYFLVAGGRISGAMGIVSVVVQLLLTVVGIAAAVLYQGQRRKRMPLQLYRIWTLPFAVILLSAFGSLCVLIVLSLHTFGVIDGI